KDPQRRYATAGALADDLERFRGGRPVRARPLGRAGRAWRWCRRNPVVAGLLAALALVFAAGFAAALWRMQEARARAAAGRRARAEAVAREEQAVALRTQAERATALSLLDQGVARCRQGEVPLGLLTLADSLTRAEEAGALDLDHALRCNLTAWRR